ncbi:Mov34/MPN/PAD-1 family protein [Tumebacillus flagellatus]|uniref:Mov34/MPN/PAD-1 family protein n=1 Tax=Tumebacillus flagellatus TaxID=1157490 RepID=UPI001376E87F|nr:M67 family metallopeptidase [Tumebacillus flagellatus]
MPEAVLQQTFADLSRMLPEEGVGLWSGSGQEVRTWTFLPNAAGHGERRVRFTVHPQDWIQALVSSSERGEAPLALVHSHPTAPPVPSAHDRKHWYYPDLWCVIVSFADGTPRWRAFQL